MQKPRIRASKGRWLALLVSALLLLGVLPTPTAVAEVGSLNIMLSKDTYDNLPKTDEVEVTVYQIGVPDSSTPAGWRIDDAFKGYGILGAKTSAELGQVAENIARDIVGKPQYQGTPITLQNGSAQFPVDALGVYFGMVTKAPEGLKVTPFIVTVPSRDPKTQEARNSYDVVLKDSCVTSVTVKKVWKDNEDQDGKRPKFIEVTLSNGQKVTLNEENHWEATVSELPKYKDGQLIHYTWTEAVVDGYISAQVTNGTVTTLTNSHTPETTQATVKKVWQDEDNADGIRPTSIEVTLSNGQKVTLNEENHWEVTLTGLPKYKDGKEIAYTWTEATVNGYQSAQVTDGTVTTLTNVHTPEPTPTPTETPPPGDNPTPTPNTEVSGKKVWVDDGNAHKTRPAGITVTLYADGEAVNATPTWTGTNTDTWSYTFSNLPAVDADGNTINYTVKETPVENYTSAVSGTTITNTLEEKPPKEYKQLTGVKTWQEVGAGELATAVANRPSQITVHLYRDGVEVDSLDVTAMTGWKYDFGEWPVDDGYGNLYTYSVREDGVPGYFARVDGLNIVNTYLTPEKPNRPGGPTPNTPPLTRKTVTPPPPFESLTEEQMDDFVDILDYGTPLWGTLLGTGDETPVYPYVFGGVGALAVAVLVIFGRKRKKKEK